MNDVAEAAGVTKPVLYQHFDSKDALYHELVDEMGAQLEEAIMKAVADADGPRQQVEAGFRAYFRWCISQGAAFRVIFADRTRSDPEQASAAARVEAMVAERVASLIEVQGLGEGADADAFADQVAELAWSGLRGQPLDRPKPTDAEPTSHADPADTEGPTEG